ncbi:MAG: aminotransferase class V-fold PLP-dependent enzyme [Oscillospiraceae bacterium]|nr:aminotransferase class V-fold PLP-dependent enzyme [Oscillospiraceae bacterium]
MIYLDNGATSFPKPAAVRRAMGEAMTRCANPGRGGHEPAMAAARTVFRCREAAGALFECDPERVVLTANCTQGLNMAIRTLVKPGDRVAVSGFEHNAVVRPLHLLGAEMLVAGRRLFDGDDTLEKFEDALKKRPAAAVFSHVSNVFGYILPVEQMAAMCRERGIPFVIDAAQSAGVLPVSLRELGADFIAMPGHKGLLGPMGTGLLLCGRLPEPLLAGGTGSDSARYEMPEYLPDRAEAGTANVPGIAGLLAGIRCVRKMGTQNIFMREAEQAKKCAAGLKKLGFRVFSGASQTGTVSFVPRCSCEAAAEELSGRGIAVRAGLHCAPLAHGSAGTLDTGTVRVSFGHDAHAGQTAALLKAAACLRGVEE